MAVAEAVGDGLDAGEAGVGCVVDDDPPLADGAVGGGGGLDDAERVAVGIEVVADHEQRHRRAAFGPRHIITSDWWLVGVAGGEDADDDGGLG